MKKGERNKRKKAEKKRTERDLKRRAARAAAPATSLQHIRSARDYPIEGCWTFQNWQELGLTTVVIARRQPDGNLVVGIYLVDFFCLGIKNADSRTDIPVRHFYSTHLPELLQGSVAEIPAALAHEIVYGGQAYAAQFGFRSHRDFKRAQQVLDARDAHPSTGRVAFGKDGKPFFVAGPYDNVKAVLRQLERVAGAGNYDYVVPMDEPPPDEWDDD